MNPPRNEVPILDRYDTMASDLKRRLIYHGDQLIDFIFGNIKRLSNGGSGLRMTPIKHPLLLLQRLNKMKDGRNLLSSYSSSA